MHNSLKARALWFSLLLSALLPLLLGLLVSAHYPDWRWSHYPFHAMLESIGAFCALTIAAMMVSLIRNGHLSKRYIMAACALIGMGLLDGFHAVLHAGGSFVWLHSIATLVGGVLFAGVWLPEAWLPERRHRSLLIVTVIGSILAGVIFSILPEYIPVMISNGQFSLLAIAINVFGGLGFLLGTAYFSYSYLTATTIPGHQSATRENLVFASHCLLFGIAGLLFEFSVLWDAGWWWWHILRFTAYLVVLVYFFSLIQAVQEQLRLSKSKLDMLNQDLEQRVLERTRELEVASNAKSEFLSRMSHELRTPLNAILGFGQLLQTDTEPPLSPQQADNVNEIQLAGRHLLALINEVLDLGRIESGRLELALVKLPIAPLVEKCLRQVMPLSNAKGITIDIKIDPALMAVLDEMRFTQVIINLFSNAIKYNRNGGSIRLYAVPVDSERVRISVEDTGIGIDAEAISRLFWPFERMVSAYDGIEGTGIGLALVKKLVNAMRGELGVTSIVGKGSTFWFELPITAADQVSR